MFLCELCEVCSTWTTFHENIYIYFLIFCYLELPLSNKLACSAPTSNYYNFFIISTAYIIKVSRYTITFEDKRSDHIYTLKNLLIHMLFNLCIINIYLIIIFSFINYQLCKFICSNKRYQERILILCLGLMMLLSN